MEGRREKESCDAVVSNEVFLCGGVEVEYMSTISVSSLAMMDPNVFNKGYMIRKMI